VRGRGKIKWATGSWAAQFLCTAFEIQIGRLKTGESVELGQKEGEYYEANDRTYWAGNNIDTGRDVSNHVACIDRVMASGIEGGLGKSRRCRFSQLPIGRWGYTKATENI
jgi:hypothetical protein